MTIIAAITRDGALGKGGDMVYHLSADLKRFKALTMGHPIIMGRRTFESFPNGPLPGRRNIVVTRNPEYSAAGIETQPSLAQALACATEAEPFVIGGGQVYAQAMPLATSLAITEIDAEAPDADTFFPVIDPAEWQVESVGVWLTDSRSGVRFRYVDYRRKHAINQP